MKRKYFAILVAVILIVFGAVSFLLRYRAEPCETSGDGFIEITLFYSDTCSVCAKAKVFLAEIQEKYPEVSIKKCPISEKSAIKKWIAFYEEYDVPKDSFGKVPAIFTEKEYFIGFNDSVADQIESCIIACKEAGPEIEDEALAETVEEKIKIPIIGEIDPAKYSLPVLAVILGFFDGFNVCSLGALILILGLVLMLKSRKKTLLFGGIFVVTTAVIYGLLILVWYRIFVVLVPFIKIMEILVGLLGVGGGIYFLRSFINSRKKPLVCEVETGKGIMQRFSAKMKDAIQGQVSIIALVASILLFASVITIVEFPCSAAVPGFFAGILAKSGLSSVQYLSYIALFVLFYMFDEIIVFLLAVFTMTVKLASKKFFSWITLAEAIILSLLGLYYLFGFLIFT